MSSACAVSSARVAGLLHAMLGAGQLWELDGRRRGPVPHGPTTPDSLLPDAAAVIKQLISTTPSLNFSLVALGPAQA